MSALLTDAEADELEVIAAQMRANGWGPDANAINRIVKNGVMAMTAERAKPSMVESGEIEIQRPGDRFIQWRKVYFLAPTPHETFDTIAEVRAKQGENQALQIAADAITESITNVEPADVEQVVKALADHWGVVFGVNGN